MSAPAFRKTVISRMLDASVGPAYLLDDRRRIVYANQSLADWLKVDRDSLAGVTCDFVAESNSPVAGLCPPPTAFEGSASVGLIHAQAESTNSISVEFLPIAGEGQATLGVFVIAKAPTNSANKIASSSEVPQRLHDVLMHIRQRAASAAGVFPLIGVSPLIRRARRQFNIAVQSTASVLVCATGQGIAERIARAIHARRYPDGVAGLVPLACGLLDAELVRTTLTAFMQRCAELETEQPPTLLLLGIEQLSADAQRELVGFLAIEELALQTLATSSKSLATLLDETDYRDDLVAALSTLQMEIRPLKNRSEDIPLAVQAAIESHNSQARHQFGAFDEVAMEQLVAYPWPGGLPEIESVIASAAKCAANAKRVRLLAEDLPREIRLGLDAVALPDDRSEPLDLDRLLFDIERELVEKTLEATRQNRAEAARRLNISRNKLLRRLAHLGLDGKASDRLKGDGVQERTDS